MFKGSIDELYEVTREIFDDDECSDDLSTDAEVEKAIGSNGNMPLGGAGDGVHEGSDKDEGEDETGSRTSSDSVDEQVAAAMQMMQGRFP